MTTNYNLKNIRALLLQGFSDADLRRLCFDVPGFRPVYNQFGSGSGKAEIVDRLLEYADEQLLMESLLELAKEQNPRRYQLHGPYTGGAAPDSTQEQPGPAPSGVQQTITGDYNAQASHGSTAAVNVTHLPPSPPPGGTFHLSGNFQGAIINLGSSLNQVTQTINNAPGLDPALREELQKLVGQLQESLQQVPLNKAEEAQAVAESAETLINQATKEKPNKTLLQISGEGLKQAAQNLAVVVPAVLTIATQIVDTIGRYIR